MSKAVYVIYRWATFDTPTQFSHQFAITCKDFEQARDVAMDMYSFDGIKYLKINTNGRLAKDARVVSYEDYKDNYRDCGVFVTKS